MVFKTCPDECGDASLGLQRLAKEGLGRLHIAVGVQSKIDGLAFWITSRLICYYALAAPNRSERANGLSAMAKR